MKLKKYSPGGFKQKGGALLAIAFSSLMFANTAHATTAAGVVLTNSVTVDYDDAGGNPQAQLTSSVDVTVDHVPGVAWGTVPADQSTSSGSTLPGAYSITLTNTGNGDDTFNITDLTAAGPTACTTGTLGSESFSFSASVSLGATALSVAASIGDNTLTVIDDSNTADSTTRGIAVNDVIVIGAETFTVGAVSENDAGSGNTVITFTAGTLANAYGIGQQVGEQATYSYGATGNAGIASNGATGCTHTHSLRADSTAQTGGNAAVQVTSGTWVTTVLASNLSVAKYVRNTTSAGKNPGVADISYGGNNYFSSGVSVNPGDILEYLIVITNSGGSDVTNVVFQDTLPQFTTYQAPSIDVDTNGDGTFDVTNEDGADTTGIATVSGQDIDVFAGTGGSEATDTGGTIAAPVLPATETVSAIRYEVQVDP